MPADLEPVAQSVLTEALRNADRHAEPSRIDVRVASDGETFSLAIENDGAGDGRTTRGGGLGLRLAALEALRYEGLVEFGAAAEDRWRVRLVVPVGSIDGGRGSGAAGPRGRRPRRRPVGLPPAARAPELGRALPRRLLPAPRRSRSAARLQPEVALVDMLLGTESGAEVCEEIHQVSPSTRVLLISGAGVISPFVARTAGRLRLHLQGLVGGRRGQGGADGLAQGPRSSPTTRRSTRRSPSASRRCSR